MSTTFGDFFGCASLKMDILSLFAENDECDISFNEVLESIDEVLGIDVNHKLIGGYIVRKELNTLVEDHILIMNNGKYSLDKKEPIGLILPQLEHAIAISSISKQIEKDYGEWPKNNSGYLNDDEIFRLRMCLDRRIFDLLTKPSYPEEADNVFELGVKIGVFTRICPICNKNSVNAESLYDYKDGRKICNECSKH